MSAPSSSIVLAVVALSLSSAACYASEPVADFGDNPGALDLYQHVPADAVGPMPLVLLLHGCSQSASDYEGPSGWRALADEHGFALVLAEQPASNNVGRCFNWFEPGDIERDEGEAASLASAVAYMIASHDVDPARVFVTGVSAGGAMTAVMLASYPELFAAGAVVAGGPYKCAEGVNEAFSCMSGGKSLPSDEWGDLVRGASDHEGPWPRLAIWHGDEDTTVSPANADALELQWLDVHGLSADDVVSSEQGGAQLRRFGDDDGAALIERWSLSDVGHAIPVDPDQGCGALGPFLVDVDVCSSEHIARFFGLLASDDDGTDAGPDEGSDGGQSETPGPDADVGGTGGCACSAQEAGGAGELLVAALVFLLSAGRRRRCGRSRAS